MMPPISTMSGLAKKLIVVAMLSTCVANADGPRLACSAPLYDFGRADSTVNVSHVFLLTNTGDAPLSIKRVRVCCGATAMLGTNTIAAGTSTTLRVTLALDGKLGRVEKAIYVLSNDPVAPIFRLALTGEAPSGTTSGNTHLVMPEHSTNDVSTTPPEVVISQENEIHKLVLRARGRHEFTVLHVRAPDSRITTQAVRLGPGMWQITLSQFPPALTNACPQVVVELDGTEMSEIIVPVRYAGK
jgi:hypothetical protein